VLIRPELCGGGRGLERAVNKAQPYSRDLSI
jgi:hypothetical protein